MEVTPLPPELASLSPDQKLALAERLWEEAERERPTEPGIDDETWAILKDRIAEAELNGWQGRTWEEYRAELLSRLKPA